MNKLKVNCKFCEHFDFDLVGVKCYKGHSNNMFCDNKDFEFDSLIIKTMSRTQPENKPHMLEELFGRLQKEEKIISGEDAKSYKHLGYKDGQLHTLMRMMAWANIQLKTAPENKPLTNFDRITENPEVLAGEINLMLCCDPKWQKDFSNWLNEPEPEEKL